MVLRPLVEQSSSESSQSIPITDRYIQGSLNFCRYLHTPHARVQLIIDSRSSLAATGSEHALCGPTAEQQDAVTV